MSTDGIGLLCATLHEVASRDLSPKVSLQFDYWKYDGWTHLNTASWSVYLSIAIDRS